MTIHGQYLPVRDIIQDWTVVIYLAYKTLFERNPQ